MNYVDITNDLVSHYSSIRKASKKCNISNTTFYELYKGKTTNPHISTHNNLINEWIKIKGDRNV